MFTTSETVSPGRLWPQKKFWANSDRVHVLAKWLDRERNGAEAGSDWETRDDPRVARHLSI